MNCLKCGKPAHLCGGVWRCERCGDLAVALCASGQKGAQPSRLSDGTPEGQGETSERVFHDCRVQFSEGGWAYSYLLNDPLPQIGDAVVVPFGKKNLEKVGIIVSIGDHLQNNLPYPLEKTKMVIRKAAPSDILAERESTPPAQPVEKEVAVKKNEKQDALAGAISAVSDKLKTVYKKVEPPDEQAVKSGAPAEQPAEQNTTAAAEQGEPDKADSRPVAEEQRSRRRFSFRKLAVSVAVLLLLGGRTGVFFNQCPLHAGAAPHWPGGVCAGCGGFEKRSGGLPGAAGARPICVDLRAGAKGGSGRIAGGGRYAGGFD